MTFNSLLVVCELPDRKGSKVIWTKLIDGINDYGRRHDISRLSDLVGTVAT